MIHKATEEWFDTVVYIGIIAGMLCFFCMYWRSEFSLRCVEVVLQEFLDETAISGKITREEYDGLCERLYDICPEYNLKINCYLYSTHRIYDLISEETWREDFEKRNKKKTVVLKDNSFEIRQQNTESLHLQNETNDSVLAAVRTEYLPLLEEKDGISVCAVRTKQEVYEGESIITLCRIDAPEGAYYAEALPLEANESGVVLLELSVEGTVYHVPVEVICHPRIVVCDKGHAVVNTKEIMEESKLLGKTSCPFCSFIPEYISVDKAVVSIKTGTPINKTILKATVTYLDGSTEVIVPDSEEWQDDFDPEYCGTQEVTIRYRNKETKITLISENSVCNKCGGGCNDRSYKDYLEYPYCIECLSLMYMYTGETRQEEQLLSEAELLSILDSKGEVLFTRGDFMTLTYRADKAMSCLQKEIKMDGRTGEKE